MNKKILTHFKKVDPLLYKAYLGLSDQNLLSDLPTDYFSSLCDEIISQQLSGKVATVIFGRFQNLFPKKQITAKYLVTMNAEALRGVGMSGMKAKFLLDLASKVVKKEIFLEQLAELDDASVIKELIKVKGIGPWTAEMFLIFSLGRE